MKTRIWLFLGLVPLLSLQSFSETYDPKPKADIQYAANAIRHDDLSSSLISSSSAIFLWFASDHGLDLTRALTRAYENRDTDELREERTRRTRTQDEPIFWPIWVDAAVVSTALDDPEAALAYIVNATLDPLCPDAPFLHVLAARAYLRLHELDKAKASHRAALKSASGNASKSFQVNYQFVEDLYNHGYSGEVFEEGSILGDCAKSAYPLERAFSGYERLLHAWSVKDATRIESGLADLKEDLPQITLDRGTAFERRRYDEAENLVRRIERAQAGNEAVRMILDEESCHFDRLSGNHLGIVERLNPWIQRYPLSKYDTLTDEEILFAVRWVYATYLAAMATAGRYAEAEVGIEEFLNRVPFEDSPGMVVDMNLWLAWTLHRQGRYDEAVVQYEIGLQLDGSDSPDIVLPDYFTKTGIPKGLTTNRKTFVHYYRNALAALGGWEAGR